MPLYESRTINKRPQNTTTLTYAAADSKKATWSYEIFFQKIAVRNTGKLGANWEGPYKIIKVVRPGAYEIANKQDVKILRTWNAMHLKKYYHKATLRIELRDGLIPEEGT